MAEQEPKAERELEEEPELEAEPEPNYGFIDSRRLTGPSRYFDGPAVTLTPIGAAAGELQALERWAEEVRRLSKALGWPDPAPLIDRAGDGTYPGVSRAAGRAIDGHGAVRMGMGSGRGGGRRQPAFDRAHDFGEDPAAMLAARAAAERNEALGRSARGRACGTDCPCWRTTRRFPSVPAPGA